MVNKIGEGSDDKDLLAECQKQMAKMVNDPDLLRGVLGPLFKMQQSLMDSSQMLTGEDTVDDSGSSAYISADDLNEKVEKLVEKIDQLTKRIIRLERKVLTPKSSTTASNED